MSIALTAEQAEAAAAEVVEHLRTTGGGLPTAVMSDAARQVLDGLVGRYARTANAVRRVSPMLLAGLPGDDELGDAPVFADQAEAEAWYVANADGILETLVLAGRHGADSHSAQVVRGLERVLVSQHDIGRWLAMADLALAAARRHRDKPAEAHALLNRGAAHRMARQPTQAIADYKTAARLFAELDDAAGTVEAINRLGVALFVARHLDDAEDAFIQVLALTGSDDVRRAMAYVNRGFVATERGETSTAIAHGLVGLEILQTCGAHELWIVEARLALTTAYTRAGDTESAGRHLTAVTQLFADGFESVPARISTAVANGELLLAQGHHRDAVAAFQRAVMLQSAAPYPYRLADSLDGLGEALFKLGEVGQAVEQHAAALSARNRAGEPFATAQTSCRLAKAKAASGQQDEAAHLREQALLKLVGLVDPAADALRAELNRVSLDVS